MPQGQLLESTHTIMDHWNILGVKIFLMAYLLCLCLPHLILCLFIALSLSLSMHSGMAIMPAIAFILIVKPYRVGIYNTIDGIILLSFALFCYGASAITLSSFNLKYRSFSIIVIGVGLVFPVMCATVLVIYAILPRWATLRVRKFIKRFTSVNRDPYEDTLLEILKIMMILSYWTGINYHSDT